MAPENEEKKRARRAGWYRANRERIREGLRAPQRPPPSERLAPVAAADFAAWLDWAREHRGWGRLECSRRLGCAENSVTAWAREGAPAYVGLACAALVRGLGPWKSKERTSDA